VIDEQKIGYFVEPAVKRETGGHHLWKSVRTILFLNAAVYALCFGMEGAMRLKYGIGSLTAIENAIPQRGLRAKAIVARQKLIDVMTNDPVYDAYICIIIFGAPIAIIGLLIHDIRLANRLMRRFWFPLRWFILGFVIMSCSGLMLVLGPFVGAQNFYDRVSPAELFAKLL
jgi:hypothetical protein